MEHDYWYNFSWMYLLFATLFVIMLQGGCLHSLYRYTLCTPFFYIIVLKHLNKDAIPGTKSIFISAVFVIACIAFFNIANYGKEWNFTKAGFILLLVNLMFFLAIPFLSRNLKYMGYGLLILASMVWNAYLLNMFVSQAWVFL